MTPGGDSPKQDAEEADPSWMWFLRGVAGVCSMPAFILMSAFVGFAGLARETGIPLGQAVFMTATIWAMPSQIVLIGAIASGASLVSAWIAVALASVRLTPMVVAWVPVIRSDRTPTWALLALAHFIAITAWVFAMTRLPQLKRRVRMPYFAGFAITLTACNIAVTAIAYAVAEQLPAMAVGALFMMTPCYFLFSLWNAATNRIETTALVVGLVLGPLFFVLIPSFDLLFTGLIGGTAVYFVDRRLRRRSRSDGE